MKNIIVLGGGAAGWLTALYLNKIFDEVEIKIIESEKIGILGAGEGSTPNLINFLNYLGVDVKDLLNKTKGTIKHGINFENWNGDNKKYFHGFCSLNELNQFSIKNLFTDGCYSQYLINCISKNLNLDEFTYGALLTENKKIDLVNQDFSIHFDAHEIANYLKEFAKKRGVHHIVGDVELINQDELGFINEVKLIDKKSYKCDFIFDCSGFKRLIVGKIFKTPWVNYQKHLPMKKAVPFFLEQENEIYPCTHAIAMKYGWMWKIPLQHRFGAGYIYDSDYINEDQALEEAQIFLKRKLQSPRVISFDAGRFKNVWVKNCIAVGLSAGFTEPLEATSLFITVQQLILLSHFKEVLFNASEGKRKNYNEIMGNSNDDILDFLYFHYITKRNDSKFWLDFKEKTKIPSGLEEKLENIKNNNFININFDFGKTYASFEIRSYLSVAHGLGMININDLKEFKGLHPQIDMYKTLMLSKLNNLYSHRYFLNSLKDDIV